jgi:hypothetical protein
MSTVGRAFISSVRHLLISISARTQGARLPIGYLSTVALRCHLSASRTVHPMPAVVIAAQRFVFPPQTRTAEDDSLPVGRPHSVRVVTARVCQPPNARAVRADRTNLKITVAEAREFDNIPFRGPSGKIVVIRGELGDSPVLQIHNAQSLLRSRHSVHDPLPIGRPARKRRRFDSLPTVGTQTLSNPVEVSTLPSSITPARRSRSHS